MLAIGAGVCGVVVFVAVVTLMRFTEKHQPPPPPPPPPPPEQNVERTECLWHKDALLTLKRVEVMELRKLSYYYVSRLNPVQVQLDARTAAGHAVPAPAKECRFVPWRDIQASAEQAGTGWADVID